MKKAVAVGTFMCLIIGAVPSGALAQNAERGKHVFRKCLLCHVLDPKSTDHLAPPLHNIVGRRAASINGFVYSSIMKFAGKKGFVWTREAMYYFLDKPEEFMPGTYMAFAGLETQERRDVIAYLEKLTRDYKKKKRRPGKRSDARPKKMKKKTSRIGQFSPPR